MKSYCSERVLCVCVSVCESQRLWPDLEITETKGGKSVTTFWLENIMSNLRFFYLFSLMFVNIFCWWTWQEIRFFFFLTQCEFWCFKCTFFSMCLINSWAGVVRRGGYVVRLSVCVCELKTHISILSSTKICRFNTLMFSMFMYIFSSITLQKRVHVLNFFFFPVLFFSGSFFFPPVLLYIFYWWFITCRINHTSRFWNQILKHSFSFFFLSF